MAAPPVAEDLLVACEVEDAVWKVDNEDETSVKGEVTGEGPLVEADVSTAEADVMVEETLIDVDTEVEEDNAPENDTFELIVGDSAFTLNWLD